MTDERKYSPIACEAYSELEVAILHKQWLRVAWKDAGGDHVESLLPLDLETRNREEFLVAESQAGERLGIRLDYLKSFQAVDYD